MLLTGAAIAPPALARQLPALRVENFYPHQAAPGQTTLVTLVVTNRAPVQRAEITPPDGVTVVEARTVGGFQGNASWVEVRLQVAGEAQPGPRTLVLELPNGRTPPVTITIPTHAPTVADLRATPGRSAAPTVDVELVAIDSASDLGEGPHVWFVVGCGAEPIRGVVRGVADGREMGQGVVRASLPRPASGGTCELTARVSDTNGTDSNTLRTTVSLPASQQPPSAHFPVRASGADQAGEDWLEFVSQDERFTAVFPGTPTITDTAWFSQFGAVLPARVYHVTQGQSRFTITVVDYRVVERVQVEKARACPAGANTCQGIPDWGIGYWKNDIRGAIVYGMSKFLMRDAKVTEIIWNGIALVQGQALQLTNADTSQTFVSVYMHDNRLVIVDATVPAAYPAPVAFTESLGWIDERGRAVRYQTMYVNMPDVPKPAPR